MLRPFKPEDFKLLNEWAKNAEGLFRFSGSTWEYPLDAIQMEKYISTYPDRLQFIYIHQDIPVGFGEIILLGDHAPRLSRLIVSGEYRGKGLGSNMVDELESECLKIKAFENIYLFVLEDNSNARRCYEKCGFKDTDEGPFSLHFDEKEYPVLKMIKHIR